MALTVATSIETKSRLIGRWTPARQRSALFDLVNAVLVLLVWHRIVFVLTQLTGAELGNGNQQFFCWHFAAAEHHHKDAIGVWCLPLKDNSVPFG